jgi:CDGSH-type Zn-finger protein
MTDINIIENGPAIITSQDPIMVGSMMSGRVAICRCGRSKNQPFCDGSHKMQEVINTLAETNDPDYNLTKASEELNELGTVALQLCNKRGAKEPAIEDILTEVADCEVRVAILKKVFGSDAVDEKVRKKLDKYKGYIQEGKYTGRI